MKKILALSLPVLAFLQATALVVYVIFIALIFNSGAAIFGPVNPFFGPIFFLLLFIISAVISALLVLSRAGYLFWERKYSEAFTLLGWTLGWCFLYLFVVALVMLTPR